VRDNCATVKPALEDFDGDRRGACHVTIKEVA